MSEISSSLLGCLEGVILLVKMEKDCSTSLKFLDIVYVLVSGQLVMVAMLIASSISVNSIH